MKLAGLFFILLWLAAVFGYCLNLFKLVSGGIDAPGAIIRVIGLLPPVGAIVGWM